MAPGNKPSLKTVSIKEDNNKDELDKVLDTPSLDILKAKFPEKVDEIFKISKAKLAELKKDVEAKDYTKVEEIIREELIEDDIDGEEEGDKEDLLTQNEHMGSLDTITLGVKSEKIKKLRLIFNSLISDKIKKFGLNSNQESVIVLGITGKIINSGALISLFKGMGNGLDNLISQITGGKFKEASKSIDDIKNIGKLQNILDDNIGSLLKLLENKDNILKNPKNNESFMTLLSNPEYIEGYKYGDNLTSYIEKFEGKNELSKDEQLKKYLLDLNTKVLGYDSKMEIFYGMYEGVIKNFSSMPELLKSAAKGVFEFLLGLPFIGKILATLLGYDSPQKAIEGFGEELKYAEATNNLSNQGGKFDNTGVFTSKSPANNIKILENKNLDNLSYKKLIPFYKMCKKEGIDYTKSTIWSNLFNPITLKKGNEKLVTLNGKLKKDSIKDGDFENNKPKDSFYEKLNKLQIEKPKKSKPEYSQTSSDLKKELKGSQGKEFNENDLKSGDNWFEKLDDSDLHSLKGITIEQLLGNEYEKIIKDKINFGPFDNDYDNIKGYIKSLRNTLNYLKDRKGGDFKKYIADLIKVDSYKEITIEKLLNSKVIKKLYKDKTDIVSGIKKRIESTKNKENDEKLLKSIKEGLDNINSEGKKISFEFTNKSSNKENIIFDFENQEIIIGDNKFKLELHKNTLISLNISNLEKKGNEIILKARSGFYTAGETSIDIETFALYMFKLVNGDNLDINNDGISLKITKKQ